MVSTIVSGHYRGLSMAKGRQRRLWEDDEKRRIIAQTKVPGVSVSQVARRYDVNANLVFKWLRDPRFQPSEEDVGTFLPVEILPDPAALAATPVASDGQIELTLPNGYRLSIRGSFDADAVCSLVRGLNE